jgi:hypothetical protein
MDVFCYAVVLPIEAKVKNFFTESEGIIEIKQFPNQKQQVVMLAMIPGSVVFIENLRNENKKLLPIKLLTFNGFEYKIQKYPGRWEKIDEFHTVDPFFELVNNISQEVLVYYELDKKSKELPIFFIDEPQKNKSHHTKHIHKANVLTA